MKRWMTMLLAILLPSGGFAQDTVRSWPGLDASALSTVYVVDETGAETIGALLRLNPDSLVLLVDGVERRFDATRVRRLDKRGDSLRNGALIGAVVGIVMGLVSAGISDCPGDDPGGRCLGTRAAIAVVSAGVYAGIGTGVDALVRGRTTLYVAPAAPTSAARSRVGTRPHRRRAAVNLGFAW